MLSPIQQQFVPTLLRCDPALAYDDVADGIISLNCARYGVAFTDAGGSSSCSNRTEPSSA